MKINHKKTIIEADVERLVEKGMDQHEANWSKKFETRHTAKKELKKLEHQQKIELEELKQKKENWFEKRENAKMRKMQLEQELKEKQKKEENKRFLIAILILFIMFSLCITLAILGSKGIF